MKILKIFNDTFCYLSEGTARLFSPNRDNYPNSGVQPYSGDTHSKRADSKPK